jgi:hypothetical protein
MAVAYDTTVSKNNATSPSTMTAAPTAGTAGLLFVGTVTNGSTGVISATYDGTAMTQVGTQINSGPYNTFYYIHLSVFKIDSTPSGSKTISISSTGTVTAIRSTFTSYSGVASIGSLQQTTATGASMSHTTTSATDNMIAQAFYAATATSITSYNKTTRGSFPTVGWYAGDSVGASSVTFTATQNSSAYHSAAVDLTAAVVNTLTPSGASISVTGAVPSLITGSVVTPAADIISITGTAPTLITAIAVAPSGASIAVTGTAPSLVTTSVLTPAAAAISVTGSAPTLDVAVSPPGAVYGALITVTGSAPTLTTTTIPGKAAITVTGGTPSTAGVTTIAPSAAAVSITAGTPRNTLTISPNGATVAITTGTPNLPTVGIITASSSTITVTGGTPLVSQAVTKTPAGATITITGATPTAAATNAVSPTAATIALTGSRPLLLATLIPAPPTISITGTAPALLSSVQLSPAKASISVTGGNALLTVNVYTAPAPVTRDTLIVRHEERKILVSGTRSHLVNRASRSTEA